MAFLFVAIFSTLVLPVLARKTIYINPDFNEFIFPNSSADFPLKFDHLLFNGSRQLQFQNPNLTFNAYFSIPINQKDIAHEIELAVNNDSTIYNLKVQNGIWSTFSLLPCDYNYVFDCWGFSVPFETDSTIRFFVNDSASFNNQNIKLNDYQWRNHKFYPFQIRTDYFFTLKMVTPNIKLAFHESQFKGENRSKLEKTTQPPKAKSYEEFDDGFTTEEPPTTTSESTVSEATFTTQNYSTSTTSAYKDSDEFKTFVPQNYDYLFIIAILCFLLLFCLMLNILLLCFYESESSA